MIVHQSEKVAIERLGKFHRLLGPGLHIIVPFLDRPRYVHWSFVTLDRSGNYVRYQRHFSRVDIRELVYDFPKQNVITKDNVTIQINALLYFNITDVHAAIYEVGDLPQAIESLTQTTLRNVIGSLDLDESLVSRDAVNEKLRIILDEATDKWGVKVNRVELQEITPPRDIREAMEKQMRAERDRRARILEAEGIKRSDVLIAEGKQQSAVLKAQGQAQAQVIEAKAEAEARLAIAQAEAEAMGKIRNALGDVDPTHYLLAQQYIKAFGNMTEQTDNKLVVVPYEASSFAGTLSSLKEIMQQK